MDRVIKSYSVNEYKKAVELGKEDAKKRLSNYSYVTDTMRDAIERACIDKRLEQVGKIIGSYEEAES